MLKISEWGFIRWRMIGLVLIYLFGLHFSVILINACTNWVPQREYNQSLELAALHISAPNGIGFRYKPYKISELNFKEEAGVQYLSAEVKGLPAVIKESMAPPLSEAVPVLLLSPLKFKTGAYEGDLNSWESYGKFFYKLNQGRDGVPSERVVFYKGLVSDTMSDYDKVKHLYNYLRTNYRYVSVQKGIGGIQTTTASYVDKNMYGDCKGLSYFLKAMLKAVGIESCPVLIYGGEEGYNPDPDFPNFAFNHMILMVPLEKDTIWIETTSADLPFNYLGDFTDNRLGLLVTEFGSKLIRTPRYGTEINQLVRQTEMYVSSDTIASKILVECKGSELTKMVEYNYLSEKERKEKFISWLDIQGVLLSDFNFDYSYPEAKAIVKAKMEFKSQTITGGRRVFVAPVVFHDYPVDGQSGTRKRRFISREEREIADTVIIHYPSDLTIESGPSSLSIESRFGKFKLTILTDQEGEVLYIRKLTWNKFDVNSDEYQEYQKFIYLINETVKSKIVFVKGR